MIVHARRQRSGKVRRQFPEQSVVPLLTLSHSPWFDESPAPVADMAAWSSDCRAMRRVSCALTVVAGDANACHSNLYKRDVPVMSVRRITNHRVGGDERDRSQRPSHSVAVTLHLPPVSLHAMTNYPDRANGSVCLVASTHHHHGQPMPAVAGKRRFRVFFPPILAKDKNETCSCAPCRPDLP